MPPGEDDTDETERARVVLAIVAWTLFGCAVAFSLFYIALGLGASLSNLVVTMAGVLVVPLIVAARQGYPPRPLSHGVLAILWLTILATSVVNGGPIASNLAWLPLLPALAILTVGQRGAWPWGALAMLQPLALYAWVAAAPGQVPPPEIPASTRPGSDIFANLTLTLTLTFIVARIEERRRQSAIAESDLSERLGTAARRTLDLLDVAPIAVVIARAGRVRFANLRFASLVGLDDPTALEGLPIERLWRIYADGREAVVWNVTSPTQPPLRARVHGAPFQDGDDSIYLLEPVQDLELAHTPATRPAVVEGRGERPSLLVVDDEPLLARALHRMLGDDIEVSAAESAEEAMALLGSRSFDCILCDLGLTGASGLDLFRSLRQGDSPLADRMVFCTGDLHTPEAQALLHEGRRLLAKPFELGELREALARTLPLPPEGRARSTEASP